MGSKFWWKNQSNIITPLTKYDWHLIVLLVCTSSVHLILSSNRNKSNLCHDMDLPYALPSCMIFRLTEAVKAIPVKKNSKDENFFWKFWGLIKSIQSHTQPFILMSKLIVMQQKLFLFARNWGDGKSRILNPELSF